MRRPLLGWRPIAIAWLCCIGCGSATAQDATALKARYASLRDQLASSPFGRPLYLESTPSPDASKGDVYSVVDYRFAMVEDALRPVDHWCDILILHLNVKGCRSHGAEGSGTLSLAVGKKFDQPVEDAYKLEFTYRAPAATDDYLQVRLDADEGPLGTHDYRIRLEAVPIDAKRSFLHMSYSYGYGFAARMATEAYLATIGSDKVGFSKTVKDGKVEYVKGFAGLIERNTMRYYLAIDSYLAAYDLPPAKQAESRIRNWYAQTERYAQQLHEMDKNDYLRMKRREMRRDNAPASQFEAPRRY